MALTRAKLIADGVIDVDNLAAGHSITTSNIGEGSNLYYTDGRVASYLTTNSYATESFVTTGYLPLSGGNITGNLTVDTNTLFVDATSNNIGVGTSTPDGNLHIATTGNATLILEGDTDNSGDSDTQVDATIRMMTDGGTNWWDIEAVNRSQNSGWLNFNFTGGGSAKIGVFTDTPTMELDVVGRVRASQGIYFGSDTAAANALDDYEEGTWTPVLRGSSTAGTYEISTIFAASYTKIGRLVTISTAFSLASAITGGGTGYAQIVGVPFAKAANQSHTGSVVFINVDISGDFVNVAFADPGSTSILYFPQIVDNASVVNLPISAFSASDYIQFSITYFT